MSEISLSEFADRLNELMPVITREFLKHQTSEFYKMKITLPQFVILDFLSRSGESKMTDMANFMNVTTAAMTGIVERLVKGGYVARTHDPDDRRIVKIRLTPKGINIVKNTMEQRHKITMEMFGKISQKEREDYLNILMHIHEHLKE